MQQAVIDEMYQRLGRHLAPLIRYDKSVYRLLGKKATADRLGVVMGTDDKPDYQIYEGVCSRTGLKGHIVRYEKAQAGTIIVPTLAKLLWMFATQDIYDKDNVLKGQRIGGARNRIVMFTETNILSNVKFATKIPRLKQMDFATILQTAATSRNYLFLSFGKNLDVLFKNGFRRSMDNLEVNGDLGMGAYHFVNCSVSLKTAKILADFELDGKVLYEYYQLYSGDALEEDEQMRVTKLEQKIGADVEKLRKIIRTSSLADIILANSMRSKEA